LYIEIPEGKNKECDPEFNVGNFNNLDECAKAVRLAYDSD